MLPFPQHNDWDIQEEQLGYAIIENDLFYFISI